MNPSMRIIKCQSCKTELLETPADLIKRAGLTPVTYRRLAASQAIPPPAFQCQGVALYAPYTSYSVLQGTDRCWVYCKAPVYELFDVQTLASLINITPVSLVKAVRRGLVPEPAYACSNQFFWLPDIVRPALTQIRDGIFELAPVPSLPAMPPLTHVYSMIGTQLNLERHDFDVRLLTARGGYGRWRVDTANGETYAAISDPRGGVQLAVPLYIPPDLDP